MNILMVASECTPFVKTGGLGDVIGSLPPALVKCGHTVQIVLPLYQEIGAGFREEMDFLGSVEVSLSWRKQYCGIFKTTYKGVSCFFLDNEYYFKRENIYGHYDDGERFAFLSKAALEIIPHIGVTPDIIHAHDWQTALVPVYVKGIMRGCEWLKGVKTVFTIHNIQYQGRFDKDILENVFGIGITEYYNGLMEHSGEVNLIKSAVEVADFVTTVSPTYAKEIQHPSFGYGLDTILKKKSFKLKGILNGIDEEFYDPMTDREIFFPYNAQSRDRKVENKKALQELLGLPAKPGVPVLAIVSRLVDHKGMDLVQKAAGEILSEDIELIVIGKGQWQYEQGFAELQKKYPGKVSALITFDSSLAQKIYAGADMLLMPSYSEPCGLSQMIAMRYGTVPIVRRTGGLADTVMPYDKKGKTGSGFVFEHYHTDELIRAVHDAVLFYKADRDQWDGLVLSDMTGSYGWEGSAKEYANLYESLKTR